MKTHAKHHAPGLTPTDVKDNKALATALAAGQVTPGSSSAADGDLKRLLGILGYGKSAGDAFDASTATALQEFQGALDLPPTGTLAATTLKDLVVAETRVRQHPGELDIGQKNAGVTKMEKQLETLGYLAPTAASTDGVFTKADGAALEAFRKGDHLKSQGTTLGAAGKKQLAVDVQALNHIAYRERVKPTSHLRNLDKLAAKQASQTNADGTVGVGVGAKGEGVATIQGRLEAAGFDPKSPKGTFNARTAAAVTAFQKKSGLPATGQVDAKTWEKLAAAVIYSGSPTHPAQSYGERDGAVLATQQLLVASGAGHHVEANGLFDSATESAVKAFQKKEHLHASGQVDAGTLAKLKKVAAANAWHAGSWKPGPGTLYGGDTSMWESDATFQRSIKGAAWSGIKATQGTGWTDPTFQSRWNELGHLVDSGKMKMRMADLFLDPGDGVAQVKHFLDTVGIHGKLKAGTRLALDWEGPALGDANCLRTAANYIHQVTGVWPVVYVQGSMEGVAHSTVPSAPIWEAAYGSGINRNVPFFQYGDGSDGTGYDEDVFNGTLSALEKFAGY